MRWVIIACIRLYQVTLSPIIGPCCRFHPSCSEYCRQAVKEHGCFRGLWLGLKRICKCHPYHPGGLDPVPEKKERDPKRVTSKPS